jgi:hypothetical protein
LRAQPYVPEQIKHTFVEPHVAAFAAHAARRSSTNSPHLSRPGRKGVRTLFLVLFEDQVAALAGGGTRTTRKKIEAEKYWLQVSDLIGR